MTRPNKNRVNVLSFILSEVGFFGVLILAYLFFNAKHQTGPGASDLNLLKSSIFSLCLFASSFTIWRAEVSSPSRKAGGVQGLALRHHRPWDDLYRRPGN